MNRRFRAPLALVAGAAALFAMVSAPVAQAADPSPTVVSITFDDTYMDTVPALDAMQARGVKGTLYVNSQRVGFNSNYMSRAQLKAYSQNGFEVGGHTLNHEDLLTLTPEAAKANICADRTNLINLGYRVTSFAYPFGQEDATTQQAAKDCGYNSARITSDLKSPTSCLKCVVAETIPPVNPYEIRTPSTIRPSFTLDQIKALVTQAEDGGGGWVPLVFHHICEPAAGCSNSISMADFTALLDWLKIRPATTSIKTVDEVIGGAVQPPPDGDEVIPDPDLVIIGTRQHTIDGVNAQRVSNSLILYTRVRGATTGANQYGVEVAVVNGVVTAFQKGVGNMAIPVGGNVLSGHGTSATWLQNYAPVGTALTIHGLDEAPPPPPPPPAEHPTTNVTIGAASHVVNGVDIYRASGFLLVYTDDNGPTTGSNPYGFEAAVVGGKVTQVANGVGNMAIPANGYVLSGHGEARTWLLNNAVVGATVTP
jgi:peptidoglycan/xylan/chitin deacetylase (PgdA/CDA1 family)